MHPDAWKEFINALFVNQDGSRKPAEVKLTLEAGGQSLELPAITVAHSDTLQQIFRKVDRHLKTNATAPPEDTAALVNQEERITTVNVEHIMNGSKEYLVRRMSDDSFQVQKLNGEVVTPKTIVYNKLVKKYREQFGLE